jgi:hypothetical protein
MREVRVDDFLDPEVSDEGLVAEPVLDEPSVGQLVGGELDVGRKRQNKLFS